MDNREVILTPSNPEIQVYRSTVSLDPIRQYLESVRNSPETIPVVGKSKMPDFAAEDQVLNYKSWADFTNKAKQETPIYEGLLLKLKDYGEDAVTINKALASVILSMHSEVHTQAIKIAKYDAGSSGNKFKVFETAQWNKLWGRTLDDATMAVLESLTENGGSNITIERWTVPIESDENRQIDITRISPENGNDNMLGGTPNEITKQISEYYGLLEDFFTDMNISFNRESLNVYAWSPSFGLGSILEMIGSSDGNNFNLVGSSLPQDIPGQYKYDKIIRERDWSAFDPTLIIHEMAHSMTSLTLPQIIDEGLAIYSETLKDSGHADSNNLNNLLKKFKYIPSDSYLKHLQSLLNRNLDTNDNIGFAEHYGLSALLLATLYKENPVLCGRFLQNIHLKSMDFKKINLNEEIEKSIKQTGDNLTLDEIEKRMHQEVEAANLKTTYP